MSNKGISETVHKLLHDHSFVMWCMLPSEELDSIWHSWLEQHPEDKPAVDQARAVLRSVRLNDFSVPANNSEQLWKRLEASMQAKRTKLRRFLFIRYAVASVIVLLMSIAGFHHKNLFSDKLIANTNLLVDSVHTEVTLILDNHEKVEVEDNALIAYKSEITVKEKSEERTIAKTANENNPEETVMNTLVVPKGRRSSIVLPDGSRVWVNSGSVLYFPSRFDTDRRMIEAEGEIYIEVVKNNTPFTVKTDGFVVNVLGTKFNISAYKEEPERSVVLVEGSVEVETENDGKIQLAPDRKLTLQAGRNRIDEVDVYDYISWKDGLLQFKSESMDVILKRISRYYNVPINYKSETGARRSSGKLVLFDDIHKVMETFSMLYNIRYRFESDTLLIE